MILETFIYTVRKGKAEGRELAHCPDGRSSRGWAQPGSSCVAEHTLGHLPSLPRHSARCWRRVGHSWRASNTGRLTGCSTCDLFLKGLFVPKSVIHDRWYAVASTSTIHGNCLGQCYLKQLWYFQSFPKNKDLLRCQHWVNRHCSVKVMPQAVLSLLPLTQEGQSQGGQSMKAPSEATPGGSEHEGTKRGHAREFRAWRHRARPRGRREGGDQSHDSTSWEARFKLCPSPHPHTSLRVFPLHR